VEMLTHIRGLFCVGFIHPIGVVAGVQRQILFLLVPPEYVPPEDGDRIQSPKRRVSNKMDSVHNCDS
jgi:hypothetical protein